MEFQQEIRYSYPDVFHIVKSEGYIAPTTYLRQAFIQP